MKYACPCCLYYTFEEKPSGTYDICPVCYWEDDIVQLADPDFSGGANDVSLNLAKENFGKLQVQVSHPDKPVSACCN